MQRRQIILNMTRTHYLPLLVFSTTIAWNVATVGARRLHSNPAFLSPGSTAHRVGNQHLLQTALFSSAGGVDELSLAALTDHAAEGRNMGLSVARHLDIEWMDQEVHDRLGDAVAELYAEAREGDEQDVGAVMVFIADGLEKRWSKFNDDAFVNAWDIGNYISDYLISMVSDDGCACNSPIAPSVTREERAKESS